METRPEKSLKGDALYDVEDINYSLYTHNARYTYVPVRTLIENPQRGVIYNRSQYRLRVVPSTTCYGQSVVHVFLIKDSTNRPMRRGFLFTKEQTTVWGAYFPLPIDFV